MTNAAARADLLRSLHVPGDPLIVTNVWDAATARAVAGAAGCRRSPPRATRSPRRAASTDGEGLTVDEAWMPRRIIVRAVDLPVSVDFERGYARDAAGVRENVGRLAGHRRRGTELEDSLDGSTMRPLAEQVERVAAVRAGADDAGVPLVLNARVDALRRGESVRPGDRARQRLPGRRRRLGFVLGLDTAELVAQAVAEIDGPVAVIAKAGYLPLAQLADLGVARVSFGPGRSADAAGT
jgi:2-methylisocitrate lyase-like PEP mutase family enzyme